MRRLVCVLISFSLALASFAGVSRGCGGTKQGLMLNVVRGCGDSLSIDSIAQPSNINPQTSTLNPQPSNKKKDIFHRIGDFFTKYFRDFNETDTTYIEPQHFNYAFMIQNTNTYETYTLSSKSGQSVSLSPNLTYRIGPYFGWRWVFLGYTFDVNHLKNDHNKKEFDISLYSNLLSVDFYYRKTGNDYLIRRIRPSDGQNTIRNLDIPFSGINVGITGLNLTYIFNHKRFSYPAAFSQSTVQRRSSGSPLVGIGYTRHNMNLDFDKLESVFSQLDKKYGEIHVDSGMNFDHVKYTNFSLSGGYAYNWVFARNWLAAISLALSFGYKSSEGELKIAEQLKQDFSFHNLNFDGTGRIGIVWNNTRWFAGISAIVHRYNYRKKQFSTNNTFGSLNLYVGFNFIRKK